MTIQQLLDKKVIFITGKGGTGKTTLAAGLAILAARHRKRVLLAEIDMTRPSVEDIFGKPLAYTPVRLAENLDGANIEFFEGLHAYLAETISLDIVINAILRNKVVRYFLDSTPFAREIVFLNACYQYYEKAITGTGYDLIVVDLPSTGHALPILMIPQNVFGMFKVGPMLKRAREMQAFLSDRQRVALSLVALPEDMPVNETIEAFHKIGKQLPIGLGPVFVNRMPVAEFSRAEGETFRELREKLPADVSPRVSALLAAGNEASLISERCETQIRRLKENVSSDIYRIPELEEPHHQPAAYRLARALEQML